MSIASIYAVFSDCVEAERIGRIVVEERLAACVNILGSVRSIYRWHGEIQTAEEVAALFKTTDEQAEGLVGRIADLHSYDVPCVMTCSVDRVLEGYAEWIEENVGERR
jgi:periplasmic divalent cation tolerance protein